MARTRNLDAIEIRVLGVLLEKQQTTPDYYPMTISAVIAGCNQKSSREPVMKLSETEVVEALDRLAADVLAWRSVGPRSERWEHRLDRRWHLEPGSKAVMTLLLLRGPQTAGELRARSERMHRFADAAAVEAELARMAAGDEEALVRELPRLPGKRETRWVHLVGDAEVEASIEAETAAAAAAPAAASSPSPRPLPSARLVERLDTLDGQVGDLRHDLDALRSQVESLIRRLGG